LISLFLCLLVCLFPLFLIRSTGFPLLPCILICRIFAVLLHLL
jgi:hypothetical protein